MRIFVGYRTNPAGALTIEIQCHAARDPEKPGGKATPRRVEGARRAPYLQEDLLHQLFCQGAVAKDIQPYPKDRAAVAIVERGDGRFDPGAIEAGHEPLVR